MPYCPKCGATLKAAQAPTNPETARRREEKQEKNEKREKSEKHQEKQGGGVAGAIIGGLILVWLGVSFYVTQQGIISWTNWWSYFLLGLGLIIILRGAIAAVHWRKVGLAYGWFIGGTIVFVIGLSGTLNISTWWPFVLVVIGIAVMLAAVAERMRSPRP